MQNPLEVDVNDETTLLHGLQQYYIKLSEGERSRKLNFLVVERSWQKMVGIVVSTFVTARSYDAFDLLTTPRLALQSSTGLYAH